MTWRSSTRWEKLLTQLEQCLKNDMQYQSILEATLEMDILVTGNIAIS